MREGGSARTHWLRALTERATYVRWIRRVFGLGWTILAIATVDLAIRWHQAVLWVPVEWLTYALSMVYALLWVSAAHWALGGLWRQRRWAYWIAVLTIQSALAFMLAVHFNHYAYFGVPPELHSFTILYSAPSDAALAVESQFTLVNVALLAGLTLFLMLAWRAQQRQAPRRRGALIAAGVALLLTPGFAHNVYEGRGSFLPGVNFVFLAARATQAYVTGERFNRLPMANRNALPHVDRPQPYNVLFILGETLRSKSVSYEGYERDTTPNQRRFFERFPGQSFVFRHCYTTSIRTNPSVPSIVTGVHPMEFPEKLVRTPLFYKYAKVFSGTRTFIVASQSYGDYNYINFFQSPLLDKLIYQENSGKPHLMWAGMDDAYVVPFLDGELDTATRNGSKGGLYGHFFGMIHLNGTHFQYHAPPAFRRWNSGQTQDNYENAILYQDSVVGTILQDLERRGLLENTIVVFTADHGEALGEHGRFGHSHGYPYQELTQVGAWMYLPKALAARHQTALRANTQRNVSNLDWVPTLVDLLGLDSIPQIRAITEDLLGASLLMPVDPGRTFVVQNDADSALNADGFAIIHGAEQFLYHPSGGIRIFNTARDPKSADNLWGSMDSAGRTRWLSAAAHYPGIRSELEGAMAIQDQHDTLTRSAAVSSSTR